MLTTCGACKKEAQCRELSLITGNEETMRDVSLCPSCYSTYYAQMNEPLNRIFKPRLETLLEFTDQYLDQMLESGDLTEADYRASLPMAMIIITSILLKVDPQLRLLCTMQHSVEVYLRHEIISHLVGLVEARNRER